MQPRSTTRFKVKWVMSAYIIPIISTLALVVIAIMLYRINNKLEIIQDQTQMVQKEEPKEEKSNCPKFCKNNTGAVCRNMGCY